ncbi:uncharacterized protein LOC133115340 isoform X1 [Conger conger]|uniref:uncharacterized protein LOC133115340 isoform X1 n=2 Tax=Conger conger TaxID=82655 RepID=UPI002A59F28F|nr:uncharacterized protein LOC133115340 isoform X1 [Conger conger]
MRRKTTAKRVLDREHEDEREEDHIDECKSQSDVLCHGLQKRRKRIYSTKESAEENSPPAAGFLKFKTRAFGLEGPGVEHLVDGDSAPQEVDCLQLRSKAELVAMVLCMQKEMESLREQIRCLTACGKLARTLEALVERTRLWTDGDRGTPSPSMHGVMVEDDDLLAAVLNGQWAKEEGGSSPNIQPELHNGPQKNGQPVFQEFISPELLDRCNTGTTAQKLTNDLLRGLYERDCLASHSISGIVYNKRGQPKPALPSEEVQAILRAVQHYFPGKTDAEIKGYIRQKLQNEAKRLRKKPHLLAKAGEGAPSNEAAPLPHRGGASLRQPAQTSGSAVATGPAPPLDPPSRRCADSLADAVKR